MSREIVETSAIVLTSADVRDDQILHLLTPEHGRLPVVAKRARKSSKRCGGHLQPMTLLSVQMTLHEGRELGRLDGASERAIYPRLKGDLERFAYACVMVEVITHLIPPHGHEPGVFNLTQRALTHLDGADEIAEDILALFELRMLRGLGLLPAWHDLPRVPPEAIPVLEAWLDSRWEPLDDAVLIPTVTAFEHLIQQTSGRPLKSRGVLADLLGR